MEVIQIVWVVIKVTTFKAHYAKLHAIMDTMLMDKFVCYVIQLAITVLVEN